MNTQTKYLYIVAVIVFIAIGALAKPVISLTLEMNNPKKAFEINTYQNSGVLLSTKVTESGKAYTNELFYLSLDWGEDGDQSTNTTRVSKSVSATGKTTLSIGGTQLTNAGTFYAVMSITNSNERFIVGHGYLHVKGSIP